MTRRFAILALAPALTLGVTASTVTAQAADDSSSPSPPAIRLLDQAAVIDAEVRLSDVAEVTGDWPHHQSDRIRRVSLGRIDAPGGWLILTADQLRRTLSEQADLHWGRVRLRGFASCRVTRITPAAPPAPIPSADPAPVVANLATPVDTASAFTLREYLVQQVEKMSRAHRRELRIRFSDRDAAALDATVAGRRLEFEPLASVPGRLPCVVRVYDGPTAGRTLRLTLDVARRTLAVVVLEPMQRGQTFRPGDVEVREVYLDSDAATPIADLRSVLGQTAAINLRPDTQLLTRHVQSPTLVRRGELVSVQCQSGTLSIRTVGRAAADGALDEVVAVRNEKSRQSFQVRVTGARQGVVVWPDTPLDPASVLPGDQP